MTRSDGDKNRGFTPESLTLYRCENKHAFFYPHSKCPVCRSMLDEITCKPDATLVSYTTVRVSPTGSVFRLGLAKTPNGAKTLCILNEQLEGVGAVTIVKDDGLYYALPKTSKNTGQ